MSTNTPQLKIPIARPGERELTSPTSNYGDDHYSNNSDEALEACASSAQYFSVTIANNAHQVVFDDQNPYRRKSSMVSNTQRNFNIDDASCFVHQVLESQKRQHSEKNSGASTEKDGGGVGGGEKPFQTGLTGPLVAATRSRLLTKKQLSDMAWGVRELSKHLSSMRIKPQVRNVFVLTKAYDITLIDNTRVIVKFLLGPENDRERTVYVENTLEKHPRFDAPGLLKELVEMGVQGVEKRLKYWNNEMCRRRPGTFDFVVSLGGDGTVLYASYLFQQIVPPVLSFGLGSLGFLTKFDYDDFQDTLTHSFRDGISVSLRLRFECTVMRSQPVKDASGKHKDRLERDIIEELVGAECDDNNTHSPDGTFAILNDLVVDRGPSGSMSSTELFGDDEHFTNIQADGVCVATPTGSTAYNLAAGGSLCHPENPVMLVTAIAAHTLSFRPIILPDTLVLRVAVPYNARSTCWASFDGRDRVELQFGDYVSVSASRFPFATVMNTKLGGKRSEDWVRSISGKLGWNIREKQKAFNKWA